jgi:hypothetical protein
LSFVLLSRPRLNYKEQELRQGLAAEPKIPWGIELRAEQHGRGGAASWQLQGVIGFTPISNKAATAEELEQIRVY